MVHWKNMGLTENLGLNLGSANSFTLDKSLHFSDPLSSFLVGSNNYSELWGKEDNFLKEVLYGLVS